MLNGVENIFLEGMPILMMYIKTRGKHSPELYPTSNLYGLISSLLSRARYHPADLP
jgi:hypothetical protein